MWSSLPRKAYFNTEGIYRTTEVSSDRHKFLLVFKVLTRLLVFSTSRNMAIVPAKIAFRSPDLCTCMRSEIHDYYEQSFFNGGT